MLVSFRHNNAPPKVSDFIFNLSTLRVAYHSSSGMLKQARRKLEGTEVELNKISPSERLPFKYL